MPDGDLLDRVRDALASQDLDAFTALLAPDVTWGAPGDPNPPCRNRRQVVQWYQRAYDRGVRATVTAVIAVGDSSMLVGLAVTGDPADDDAGGPAGRWQVLAITDGLVSDIRGFEDRPSALAHASRASA
jgi:ketosteroid isomerase-like protein